MKTIKFIYEEDFNKSMGYGDGERYTKSISHVINIDDDLYLATIRGEFYNFLAALGYQVQNSND